jgi:hypothetical protein
MTTIWSARCHFATRFNILITWWPTVRKSPAPAALDVAPRRLAISRALNIVIPDTRSILCYMLIVVVFVVVVLATCKIHVSFDIQWSIHVYQPSRLVKNHWTHSGCGFFRNTESLVIINSHTSGQKQKPSLPGNFKNRTV